MNVKTFDVLGTNVSAINLDTAFELVRDMVQARRKEYVCVAPVSTMVDARRDPVYQAVLNAAAMVTPDGMPVVWIGRHRSGTGVDRVYGPDLMLKVCDKGREYGFRHFFYGGTGDVCDKLERALTSRFPGLLVAGKTAPPYMKQASKASGEVIAAINEAGPDIIWVGLGAPKQDFWMALNRKSLDAPVLIGIGAAFDFHAGVKPQAPRWIQRCGLEWLFRFCCEPRRLWRRYLIGNTLFCWWLLQDMLRGPRQRTSEDPNHA